MILTLITRLSLSTLLIKCHELSKRLDFVVVVTGSTMSNAVNLSSNYPTTTNINEFYVAIPSHVALQLMHVRANCIIVLLIFSYGVVLVLFLNSYSHGVITICCAF